MSNRVNSSGRALGTVKARTSLFVSNLVPAGGTLPIPVSGTSFYVTVATAPFNVRPSGGVFNTYDVGTGLDLEEINSFSLLEVNNPNPFPVVFQMFVGFDKFIDKRLILSQTNLTVVAYPTYATPNSAAAVAIDDISGQAFTDINGNEWYAIQRAAIIVCNTDGGVDLLLQESGSVVANGPAIAAIYAKTSLRLDVAGDYSLSVGGGNINAVVSELYQAIPKTS
jgi:hypothetical protein